MDRLAAMKVFDAVAKAGSFAAAARNLQLSPSVVTRAIAQLEKELGVTLIARTTRSLRLTDRGQTYLEGCRQVLQDIDTAERSVRGQSAEPSGKFKIAAPILFGRLHVLPIVTSMLRKYPALSVDLSLSDRNVHLIDEGIDAAVRIGALADSSLIAVKLGDVSRVLVASPHYLKARGVPKTPAELKQHDVIIFHGLGTVDEWRFSPGGLLRLEPRLTVNSADAAIAAAEAGIGITRLLSYQVRAAVTAGRLVPVLEKFAPALLPVNVIHPPRRVASAGVAALIDAARQYFRSHPLLPVAAWRKRGASERSLENRQNVVG